MTPVKSSKTDPQILEIPPQKMAVVHAKGAPDKVFPEFMPALYGAVYTLKFDLKKQGLPTFKVSGLRGRYPDAHLVPKEAWTMILGLPIPEDTTAMPQKVPGITVGQILHLGAYDQEDASLARLRGFITDSGYEIAGDHEEEYLTTPDAKVVKTFIRYEVKKKQPS